MSFGQDSVIDVTLKHKLWWFCVQLSIVCEAVSKLPCSKVLFQQLKLLEFADNFWQQKNEFEKRNRQCLAWNKREKYRARKRTLATSFPFISSKLLSCEYVSN